MFALHFVCTLIVLIWCICYIDIALCQNSACKNLFVIYFAAVSTGCGPQNGYCIKWLFWHTKPCMEAHHATSVRWSISLTSHVSGRPALRCAGLNRLQILPFKMSAIGGWAFWSQQHSSGTGYPTVSRQTIRCRLSSSNWNTRCSSSHSQTLSCDIS